jgi:predicted enzyme related to lactoylglutathione lyase
VGPRTSYSPGTFSWVDLSTTDPVAAVAFYGNLFGWEADDMDAGGGATYTTCRIDGDAVCGLFEMSADMRAAGAAPCWMSYVTVEDADATAARALDLGGITISDAFDVLDAGRMAVLADPPGAVFAVWQARARIGAERVNDVGCLTMNELTTPDIDAARSFYERLFGWTTEPIDTGPDGPTMRSVFNRGSLNGTLTAGNFGPPHWRPYFTVESTESALERLGALGGTTLVGPIPVPSGSFAIVADPQGAEFALFEGETDP